MSPVTRRKSARRSSARRIGEVLPRPLGAGIDWRFFLGSARGGREYWFRIEWPADAGRGSSPGVCRPGGRSSVGRRGDGRTADGQRCLGRDCPGDGAGRLVSTLVGAPGRRLSGRHELHVPSPWERPRSRSSVATRGRGGGLGGRERLPLQGDLRSLGCRLGLRCRQGSAAAGRHRCQPAPRHGRLAHRPARQRRQLATRPRSGDRGHRSTPRAQSHRPAGEAETDCDRP